MYRPLINRVRDLAHIRPERPALLEDGGSITYAELWNNVLSVLGQMKDAGVCPGTVVLLAAASDFGFIYAYLAVHALGAVAVPLDLRLPAGRIEYIRSVTSPALILWPRAALPGSRDFFQAAPSIYQADVSTPDPSSLADIMFTSGTTGIPKGVALTHDNIAASINNINDYIGNGPDDVEVVTMPLSHSFGLARLRCVLYAGGALALCEGMTKPKKLFATIRRHVATGIGLVGPAWRLLHKLSGDRIAQFRDQLRYLELGSAPLTAAEKAHLASLLPTTKVCMHYGLTEASRAAFLDFHENSGQLETIGKASPHCQIAIFASDGRRCTTGESGEICVAGAMVSRRYVNAANADNFREDSFFRTGDLGRMDSQGYIHFLGRETEMINVGGEKVSPLEIEAVLATVPGVQEVACIGAPDPVLGERVAAFVVAVPGHELPDAEALKELLGGSLESYKIPARLILVEALPHTPTGKLCRAMLKDKL